MQKKILYMTNTSYTLVSLRMNLMKSMQNNGYQVITAAPLDVHSEKLINKGFDFYHIPMSQTGTNIFQEIKTILSIVLLFIKTKPNIVHLFSIKSIIWGGVAGFFFSSIKITNTFTGMGFLRSTSSIYLRKSLFFIIKLVHSNRKHYIFQNYSDLVFFEDNSKIKINLHLIKGSGVDTDFFTRVENNNKKVTFLMFSRMLYSKGVMHYLDGVKELNKDLFDKAEFLLLGGAHPGNSDGIDNEWLAGLDSIDPQLLLYKANDSGVTWLKHDSNILEYLSISDVVVLPSYYPEGLPRSLLEAMSCENIIITSNNPGCKDVIDGTNGFLVDIKNSKQLSDSIEKCIKMDRIEFTKMKKRSREIVNEKFSDSIVISSYENIYQKL